MAELRASFRAMGSVFTLAVRVPPQEAQAAREALLGEVEWLRRAERALSRFDPDSELSRINGLPGSWCVVSPLLYSALEAAARAWRLTGGLFDPAILPALERWGYHRDFREIREAGPGPDGSDRRPAPPDGTEGVIPGMPLRGDPGFELDRTLGAVRMAAGVRLDLGGIVKGLAADTSCRRLAARWGSALVDAGGDVAAQARAGAPPWQVALPVRGARMPAAVRVRRGGVATSATARRWVGPLGPAHHLIDPRAGAPARSGLDMVTVVARSAALAEVLAKAVLIGGVGAAPELLGRVGRARAFWRAGTGEVGTWP